MADTGSEAFKQLSDTIQEYYRNKKYIKVIDDGIEKELLTVDILYIEVYHLSLIPQK